MGLTPSEVEQMAATDFDLLARYWTQEPWGPWRDNMHAALIAREIRRPQLKDRRKKIPLTDFILRCLAELQAESEEKTKNFFGFFKAISNKVRASDLPTKKFKRRKVTQPWQT